jgi:hypothetical protein
VQRVATFEWHTPPPTSVDERLVIYDDATTLLLVRRSREASAAVGTFRCQPDEADLRSLMAVGPGPVMFDLLVPSQDPGTAPLMAIADRVATDGRSKPHAVAEFFARPLGEVHDGTLAASLLVAAAGTNAVEFEVDVPSSAVHFTENGQSVAWQELPDLPTGFVTPDAEGLGGVRRPAYLEPGAFGAIAFEVVAPAGATGLSIQVTGWLREALPDEPMPQRFEARTASAPIGA